MNNPLPIIAMNYYFNSDELNNRIFMSERNTGKAVGIKSFREVMNARGAEVVTLDTVDFKDPNVKHVLYWDYNWRLVRSDPFLRKVEREKRALVLLEPANINSSLYYTSLLRDSFHTVSTWDLNLLRRSPEYIKINVRVGAEPRKYRENQLSVPSFVGRRNERGAEAS